jgi:hypothetical protein
VASDLTRRTTSELAKPDVAAPSAPPPVAQQHRRRFLAVYALLALAIVAAVVGVIVFALNSIDPAPKWSSWRPSGGGMGAAQQIATRVGSAYRLQGGAQLVAVIPKSPSFATAPNKSVSISFLALRGRRGGIEKVNGVSSSNSMWYSLCGGGPSCSIATGTPTVLRGAILLRETLELALYTFKYVDGVDQVAGFMPPPSAKKPPIVVYFERNDLDAELKRPLAATLPPKVPTVETLSAGELRTIDREATPHLFKIDGIAQVQQGDWLLSLAPTARGTTP